MEDYFRNTYFLQEAWLSSKLHHDGSSVRIDKTLHDLPLG